MSKMTPEKKQKIKPFVSLAVGLGLGALSAIGLYEAPQPEPQVCPECPICEAAPIAPEVAD